MIKAGITGRYASRSIACVAMRSVWLAICFASGIVSCGSSCDRDLIDTFSRIQLAAADRGAADRLEANRVKLAALLGECDVPEEGLSAPMMGVLRDWEFAVASNNIDLVRALLARNDPVGTIPRAERNRTPLHVAAALADERIADLLLEAGFSADVRSDDGDTPLIVATYVSTPGRHAIARRLLEAGADANARTKFLDSALEYAVRKADVEMIRLLLGHGADPTLKNSGGESAIEIAAKMGNEVVLQVLTTRGSGLRTTSEWTDSAAARRFGQGR